MSLIKHRGQHGEAIVGEIYVIKCLENGRCYVGQARGKGGAAARYAYHCYVSRQRHVEALYRDMRRYGKEAFTMMVVDRAISAKELNRKEAEWLVRLAAEDPAAVYNRKLIGCDAKLKRRIRLKRMGL